MNAPDGRTAVGRLRSLFVERLDVDAAGGEIPLRGEELPERAERVATRDGVQVVALALREAGRVRADRVGAALKEIRETLTGDVLLAAMDAERRLLHVIYPSFKGGREVLRRMAVERGAGPPHGERADRGGVRERASRRPAGGAGAGVRRRGGDEALLPAVPRGLRAGEGDGDGAGERRRRRGGAEAVLSDALQPAAAWPG